MSLLVVGSVAIDSIQTPFGKRKEILGGSATYFSISASFFAKVRLVAVIGADFPKRYTQQLRDRGISLDGLELKRGKTFRWIGRYGYDLNTAHTIDTRLNVFRDFLPRIPQEYRRAPYLFLANIDPDLQLAVLKEVRAPRLTACDSMNFWITNKSRSLKRLLKKIDVFIVNDAEARLLSGEGNILKAARFVFSLGPKRLIVKRGDSGAVLLTNKGGCFNTPAYLMETIKDPTGAGDSFAGGFMGYLAKTNELSEEGMRKAVIYGNIMASFCVQDFGPNRLLRLKTSNIEKRFSDYKKVTCF